MCSLYEKTHCNAYCMCVVLVFFIVFTVGIGKPDGWAILEGWIIPECSENAVEQAVGTIGAVIMPHNLFFHSALVQTRNLRREHKGAVKEGNFYFALESAISLLVSFFINLFIVAVFAKGFYGSDDASDIGLSNAGSSLESAFGKAAKYLWALGLLAAGML